MNWMDRLVVLADLDTKSGYSIVIANSFLSISFPWLLIAASNDDTVGVLYLHGLHS